MFVDTKIVKLLIYKIIIYYSKCYLYKGSNPADSTRE